MPHYGFSATDIHGNVIEGAVNAEDIHSAAGQVQRMGYTPLRIELAEGTIVAPIAGIGVGTDPETGNGYPVSIAPEGPVDLTQAYSNPSSISFASVVPSGLNAAPAQGVPSLNSLLEYSASPLTSTLASQEPGRRLEPWERSIGLDHPVAPAQELAVTGEGGVATTGAPPVANGALAVTGASVVGQPVGTGSVAALDARGGATGLRPGMRIPYGSGYEPEKTLAHRFKERIVYPISSGVVLKDLGPFLRQFATLIDAGLPLFQALVALESNTKNGKLKEIARESQRQVQAGGRLSDAWAAYPWVFSPMQVAMIRSAEQGGMLEGTLRHLADYIEHDLEVKRTINQQTLYPKLVMFCALMILGRDGLLGGMPSVSRLILGGMGKSSYSIGAYLGDTLGFGLIIALPIIIGVIVYRIFFFNVPEVRDKVDYLKVSMPGPGKVSQYLATARFARTYAALYRSGFTAATALPIAGDASGNSVIRSAAVQAVPVVERGGLVSNELARHNIFPSMSIDMLRTGETSGSMDQLMDKVADFHESEGKAKAFRFAMIFGIAVFLLVAIMVGFSIITQWTQLGSASTTMPSE